MHTSVEPLEAFAAVYRTRAADSFRFALAGRAIPERAWDAVQEGFARAKRNRASFRGEGSIEAWVARCVINAAHDLNRVDARNKAVPCRAVPCRLLPCQTPEDGPFMEPRGCNWWQPVANRPTVEMAQASKTVAVGCDRLPFGAHGKEGVSGSSPEEGFTETLRL